MFCEVVCSYCGGFFLGKYLGTSRTFLLFVFRPADVPGTYFWVLCLLLLIYSRDMIEKLQRAGHRDGVEAVSSPHCLSSEPCFVVVMLGHSSGAVAHIRITWPMWLLLPQENLHC